VLTKKVLTPYWTCTDLAWFQRLKKTYDSSLSNCTFHFNLRSYTKEMMIHNSSEIPMRFNVRVPDDENHEQADKKPEFTCIPAAGTILPHGRQPVTVGNDG